MKLFLIDAYSLIYRAYFAFINAPRITSNGLNTSAVFGFVNTLEEVLRKENPSHIAVAFDPPGPTFRHEAYGQYKAQRSRTPEDIHASIPIIKQLIAAYRIPSFEATGFEADDVIGTLASQAASQGFEVYMLTPDKDYAQLVSDRIFMYRPRFGGEYEVMDVPKVLEKFGVERIDQIVDLLALMGDKVDNIPGCPGVGEKTAVRLLSEFGSIDQLLTQTSRIKGVLRYRIQQNSDEIRFSRLLVTIRTDVPVSFDPDLCRRQPADEVALRKLFTELEFHSFLDRFVKEPSKKKASARQASLFDALPASADSVQPSSSVPAQQPETAPDTEVADPAPHTYRIADTPEKQAELATLLSAQERFSLFFLSQSEDVWQSAPEGIAFSLREYEAWFVPLPAEHDEAAAVLSRFASPLQDKHIEKVGHDIKFAILLLRRFGIRVDGPLFDILIAHHLLHPELQHGRAYLVSTYLKHTPIRLNDQSLPNKTRLPLSQMPSQDLADYTAENADLLLRLRRFFVSTFDKDSAHVFEEVEMPLVYVLADMEFGGVALDTAALGESSLSLNSSLSLLQTTIFEMAGVSFNLNSSRQIALLLQDHFHLDVSAKTKTGLVSTGEAVLDQLRDRHPVIGKILEYRQVKKLLSTYVEALPRLVHPDTEKIHTSFNQAVVSTGRLSSTNPNLQNIPVRNELGREIRKAFTADDENCVFFSADYSQIELRILAHLSRDYTLVEAFHNKEDIHATTAAKIFHVPVDQVTPDMRRKAKSANFGIIYGISPFGLSRALGISREESSSLITNYFSSYPDVRKYLDQSLETARKNGYVETLLHRRTSVLNLNSANRAVRAAAERFVTNAPIQGSAADLIKLAMIAIYRRFEKKGLKARMIMQVHDELNFNVPCKELPTVRKIVVEEMENALPLEVPLVVDSGNGPNWLCAH